MNQNFAFSKKKSLIVFFTIAIIAAFTVYNYQNEPGLKEYKEKLEQKKLKKIKTKKARADYFFNMLRDPVVNSIPKNIRKKELEFAKKLRLKNASLAKANSVLFDWYEAGPNDVGGRTRALAVDRTNSNVIIAGGASGGIWKSTDRGGSWHIKSTTNQQLSVTFVIQDPRAGFENTWYYSSGERDNSAGSNINHSVGLNGSGFYKSTDNGETWVQLKDAGNPTEIDSPFDNVSKIVINPQTGSIFITSSYFGVLKSTDGGENFSVSLTGNLNDHIYCEIDIAANGTLLAALSTGNNFEPVNTPGLYRSGDDGETWENITPDNYESPSRAMVAFAPSNSNVAYLWTDFINSTGFYKIDVSNGTSENRTANLPQFPEPVGQINTQGGYNMILSVKPDDENFVLFGATNLYRSRDGFATPADEESENWIGGYDVINDISSYANHHSDQHSLFFDPNDPDKLWSGHDGGLSYTEDITASGERINWIDKNNGYNVTQFFHVSISKNEDDIRFLGGTQDNGSPFFQFDGTETSPSRDISSGDGAYSYIADNYVYTSAQEGALLRYNTNESGQNIEDTYTYVKPKETENILFIHPFAVDMADENIMYFPDGNILWRNNSITTIQNQSDNEGTTEGWENLGEVYSDQNNEYTITAITSASPSHILYLGLTNPSGPSKIMKLENSNTATEGYIDISIPGAPEGAFLHQIAVNPNNADEIIVVFTNYNIPSLFHSTDGGETYSNIDGNLEGDSELPGPSIRNITILPYNQSTTAYLAATSTGVYSTTGINGGSTQWIEESPNLIGNVVVAAITSRSSDRLVAAATHGRGIFVAGPSGAVSVKDKQKSLPGNYVLNQNYPNPFNPVTKIKYAISTTQYATLTLFDMLGKEVAVLINEVKQPGEYEIEFNASALSSGVYYYRLTAGGFSETKKMVLLK
ncbi:MAG: T9SS type A sorting domain-containing protein [Ignavibacteriaceae bacterium]